MTSTSNGNVSGNSEDRRRRKLWLVETYRADVDILFVTAGPAGAWEQSIERDQKLEEWVLLEELPHATVVPACRCYRCGKLCTVETVTADRIIPGILGGTYRRNNIRPACGSCNSRTGGKLGASRVKR